MNKLDALIAELEPPPHLSNALARVPLVKAAAIRRILEAVREDMAGADGQCRATVAGVCGAYVGLGKLCADCPRRYHAATRAALEELE